MTTPTVITDHESRPQATFGFNPDIRYSAVLSLPPSLSPSHLLTSSPPHARSLLVILNFNCGKWLRRRSYLHFASLQPCSVGHETAAPLHFGHCTHPDLVRPVRKLQDQHSISLSLSLSISISLHLSPSLPLSLPLLLTVEPACDHCLDYHPAIISGNVIVVSSRTLVKSATRPPSLGRSQRHLCLDWMHAVCMRQAWGC